MNFSSNSFDDLQDQLENMTDAVQNLAPVTSVDLNDLFTTTFMEQYTEFSSFFDFLSAGGFEVKSQNDFDNIPDDVLDHYVSSCTKFSNFEDMANEASSVYVLNQLDF